jgi:hypothetical protein
VYADPGAEPFADFRKRKRSSEPYAEDDVVREWIRARPDNRPVEAKDEILLYKIRVEETVLDRPALDDERRGPKL